MKYYAQLTKIGPEEGRRWCGGHFEPMEEEAHTPHQLGKLLQRAVRENDRGGCLEALDAGADPNWANPT